MLTDKQIEDLKKCKNVQIYCKIEAEDGEWRTDEAPRDGSSIMGIFCSYPVVARFEIIGRWFNEMNRVFIDVEPTIWKRIKRPQYFMRLGLSKEGD